MSSPILALVLALELELELELVLVQVQAQELVSHQLEKAMALTPMEDMKDALRFQRQQRKKEGRQPKRV